MTVLWWHVLSLHEQHGKGVPSPECHTLEQQGCNKQSSQTPSVYMRLFARKRLLLPYAQPAGVSGLPGIKKTTNRGRRWCCVQLPFAKPLHHQDSKVDCQPTFNFTSPMVRWMASQSCCLAVSSMPFFCFCCISANCISAATQHSERAV